ncbi:sugar ABC transporter ATP-binding protein [Humisphaera borealis]|uniref:Sugar ABC transporter ATP-binding protein n=1 Tax=Humisphaera borealis TaxID=2807512 RepID=A0A7M2WYL2_9BACT|nr:sugar ABC transporter ATP-binding protein [Humisphaera borealis]QOV90509.1 sugar ABC transporter ATP-binding protein [Humisphaera borealis]
MTSSATNPPLLAMAGITKRFPGVVALQDVSLHLHPGEVLALMGENGAGKSTLMKILGGAYRPDEGTLSIDGRPIALDGVSDAKKLGIALIHQELMLVPQLDIASNIFLGNERRRLGPLAMLDGAAMRQKAEELLRRVGLKLPATTLVGRLTAGQMQMVEIAKALALSARVIIMDEPTSSLTAGESEQLFAIIRQLKADGIGVIYISHRMEEVLALADRITVLRDGRYVGDLSRAEATHDRVVAMMVGRELSAHYFPQKPAAAIPPLPMLEVRDLLVPGSPASISFTAFRGEILGFAGLVGAGRTELMQTLFGVTPALGGEMVLDGERFRPAKPRDAIDRGVYLAPEDRKRHGLVLPMTVAQNTSLPGIGSYNRWGWLDRRRESETAEAEVRRLHTKTPTIRQKVVNLSGGNQQKVVLGKWLAMSPKVLILDEPTRGIDVGAKAEIYRHMQSLADTGMTILMVSSDMEEVLGISDRVVVMHERRLRGILPRQDLTQERVAMLMTGKELAA